MTSSDILITGATGFVGRNLVPVLLNDGRKLVLTVRDSENVSEAWRQDRRIRIIATGPIETAINLADALSGVSTVVHLAGLAHVRHRGGEADPFVAANTIATERLAKAAADQDVKTFIHMSSLAAITQNASSAVVDDSTHDAPQTPYGRSKLEAERHVTALEEKGLFSVSLRPPLVVGVNARGNWQALQRLAATGLPLPFASVSNSRSLIGIESLVAAIRHLCTGQWPSDKSGGYCIADEERFSLPRIVADLRRGMGLPPRLFPFPAAILDAMARMVNRGHVAAALLGDMQVDAGRFRETFGFVQERSLRTSILESGRQYRERLSGGEDGRTR